MIAFENLKAETLAADVEVAQEALYPQFRELLAKRIVFQILLGQPECVFWKKEFLNDVYDNFEYVLLSMAVQRYWSEWINCVASELREKGFKAEVESVSGEDILRCS